MANTADSGTNQRLQPVDNVDCPRNDTVAASKAGGTNEVVDSRGLSHRYQASRNLIDAFRTEVAEEIKAFIVTATLIKAGVKLVSILLCAVLTPQRRIDAMALILGWIFIKHFADSFFLHLELVGTRARGIVTFKEYAAATLLILGMVFVKMIIVLDLVAREFKIMLCEKHLTEI